MNIEYDGHFRIVVDSDPVGFFQSVWDFTVKSLRSFLYLNCS